MKLLRLAPEKLTDDTAPQADENTAVAWIMYQSADFSVCYSVGDEYDPVSKSDGVIAENAVIDGEGTYTVSLDMSSNNANGIAFSALGIANGEKLYPNYIATIDEIKINGEAVENIAEGYTTSDDQLCTRVNLVNQWVSAPPEDARIAGGDLSKASPTILDYAGKINTLEITFTYALRHKISNIKTGSSAYAVLPFWFVKYQNCELVQSTIPWIDLLRLLMNALMQSEEANLHERFFSRACFWVSCKELLIKRGIYALKFCEPIKCLFFFKRTLRHL